MVIEREPPPPDPKLWLERHPGADYAEWIKHNPPPDFQVLVVRFGSYSNIPPEAIQFYDAALLEWEDRRRNRLGVTAHADEPF